MRTTSYIAALALVATALPAAAEPTTPGASAEGVPAAASATSNPSSTPQTQPPKPLRYVAPDYPDEARKKGLEATVTLQLDVDKTGRVIRSVVVDPAGNGFDEAAVKASFELPFEPARKADGTPFGARILYRYNFTLQTVAAPSPAEPPPSRVKGTVLLNGSDGPIAGAAVRLESVDDASVFFEGAADENGNFSFDAVPKGNYRLNLRSSGFETLQVDEQVASGETLEAKYRLTPSPTVGKDGAYDVVIRGTKPPRELTRRTVTQREMDRIPGTNGDALRSIQSLPGLARPPGLAGLLIVRGSAPQDTQTFIDGAFVPLIYHFGGLSSVVPTEILERIDFFPGNFSTQYGRVMGGIVDAGLRMPTEGRRYHGLLKVDLIDTRGLLEGPIPGTKDWSFIAAGRRSYLDTWLGPVLEQAGASVTQAPVYYDYQLIAATKPNAHSKLRIALIGSDDSFKLLLNEPAPGEPAVSGNIGLHTAFTRLQLRYENDISEDTSFSGMVAFGHDDIDFGLGPFYFVLDFNSVLSRMEVTRRISKAARLHAGVDFLSGVYHADVRAPAPPRPGEPPNQPFSTRTPEEASNDGATVSPAAYAELELTPTSRLRLVPGFRVDYSNLTERTDLSPRINGRYDLTGGFPRTTAKAAVGVFYQPPRPEQAIPPLGTTGLQSNRAIHYAVGLEQEITRALEVSVEGFYKQLDELVVQRPSLSGGAEIGYDNHGRGHVIGSEVLLKYKADKRFFGWLAYTLSRSVRTDGEGQQERLFPFDQTHILTALGSYKLGNGWEFGTRFRLVSGNLVTPFVCNPGDADCSPYRTNALFHAPTGTYTAIPTREAFGERLPLFHQLDVRVDKHWEFKNWQLSAYLDLSNVYNHASAESIAYNFNFTTRQNVSGLPILPNIGLRADF